MADEEVQSGLGEVADSPVDINPKPKKKTAAKKGGRTGGKRKTAGKTGGTKEKEAAGKAPAKKKPAKKTSVKAEVQAKPRKPRVKKAVAPPADPPEPAPETLAQVETLSTPADETGSPAVVSAATPAVSVLQGAQFQLSGRERSAVTAPSTVLAQVQPQGIVKVKNIDATLTNITSHVIANKVVVQGLVHLQIFFVNQDQIVHHQAEDVPFSTFLDIPGAMPGMNVIVEPMIAAVLFHLSEDGTTLEKKVIIDVFAKVVQEVQVSPLPGSGPILLLQEVVGEGTTQTLNENFVTLEVPAIKVEEIRGELRDITTEIIPNKVIVQGTVHKQIFFVDLDNVGRHQAEDIHFSAFLDIPGAQAGMNVQVDPRIETIIFELTAPTVLRQKVVLEIFVKVTTPIQFQAALGEGSLFRVPEVIGEGTGQILRRDVVTLNVPAIKVREITATLVNLRSHVIPGKAILQGFIHKQIFFIGQDEIEHHQAEDVPFNIMVEIPGATAGLDLVAEPVIEEIIFHLLSPTELEEKVIVNARLIVVEQRQVRLALGTGPLVKVEQVVGENLRQVLVRLINVFAIQKRVVPIVVQQAVSPAVIFTQQIIVENVVVLPVTAVKVAEVSGQVENLRVTVIPGGLLVEGDVVKDIKFVGEDDVVRNITEVVPFSLIINTPGIDPSLVQTVQVQIEQILFSISPDGTTVRQAIVLLAQATASESVVVDFQVITIVEVPGVNVESVLVEAPVVTPEGVVVEQFPVITGLSGPGTSLIQSTTFGLHTFNVVGDGVQTLNVLEEIVVDP